MAVDVKTTDLKKTQSATPIPTTTQVKNAENFLSGVKSEFKKITWTDKEDLRAYTQIVVGATFICGLGVYCVDLSIRFVLASIETLTSIIFG